MQLRSVEVIPYALPFREPYVTVRGVLTRREMVLLRLRDEEGVTGLGEAVPLSLRDGVTLAQIVRELEQVAAGDVLPDYFEHAERDGLGPTRADDIDPRLDLSAPARCALLTAVADLTERSTECGWSAKPLPCNATLVSGAPEAVAESALEWAGDGFTTFKLKLGDGDDVAQVRAVREAVGAEAKIRVDANGAWSLADATRILAELEPLDVELAEQPVAGTEDSAQLGRTTSIPLAGDESIADREDAEWALETGAFALAGIKLSKVGGYSEAIEIAEAIPSYVSSALDGPVGIADGAHLAQEMRVRPHPSLQGQPGPAHGLATQRLFSSTVAAVECELRDGMLHPPPGPGLGVEIDEDALNAHRL